MRATFAGFARSGFLHSCYLAREYEGRELPPLEQRAKQATPGAEPRQGWVSLHREYDVFYRRLSAAVHHDHRLQALIEPLLHDNALSAAIHATIVTTGVLLSSAGETLEYHPAVVKGLNLVFV